MEKEVYLYDKEKDAKLEAIVQEFSSIPTEEGKIAYIEAIPLETRYEVYSYLKWEKAKIRSERLKLEAKREVLEEQIAETRADNEKLRREIIESLRALRAMDIPSQFNFIGEA